MRTADLRQAYRNLLDEIDVGDFGPPPPGELTAEELVAHLAASDELLTSATEAVLAGSPTAYYDLDTVHRPQLKAMIAEYGGLAGLATLLRATSQRLCGLVDRLGPAGQTPVRSRIREGTDLVVDDLLPWERVLDIHGRVHLPRHTAQLRKLRHNGGPG